MKNNDQKFRFFQFVFLFFFIFRFDFEFTKFFRTSQIEWGNAGLNQNSIIYLRIYLFVIYLFVYLFIIYSFIYLCILNYLLIS